MKRFFVVLALLSVAVGSAFAHEGQITDLKKLPAEHQVKAIQYCKGQYHVQLQDGSARQLKEFDLRFKTDSSPDGPRPGSPALINGGRQSIRDLFGA